MTTSLRTRLAISLATAAVAAVSIVPSAPALADGPPRTALGTWVQAEEWCFTVDVFGEPLQVCGWQCPDLSANIVAVEVFDGIRYCLVSPFSLQALPGNITAQPW